MKLNKVNEVNRLEKQGKRTSFEDSISVIIPLYNSAIYMSKTVQAVLNQTLKNAQIFLIDDCSSDDTAEVAQKFVDLNTQIRYYRLKQNSGAAVARNKGLELSNSRYVAFLDSDDGWVPDKLEKQLDFMKKNKCAFSFTAYDSVDNEGNLITPKIKIKEHVRYKDILTKTMISTPTVMIDRSITGDVYMPLRRTGQDYAFWLLLLRKNDAFGIDEALVHVCRRKGSLSKNKFQNIKDIWEIQTKNEHISYGKALIHVIAYCFYTLKKHFGFY